MNHLLRDKVVLITGSTGRIGQAIAMRFAQEGALLVINSRTNTIGGAALVKAIELAGGKAIYHQADVTQPDAVHQLFHAVVTAFGTVDILINNAGGAVGCRFLDTTKEHWLHALEQNLVTAVLCSQAAAAIMLDKGKGNIINTASVRGIPEAGRENIMAYSAAKASLISFTKTLAKELAPAIVVNAVAPGFVEGPYYNGLPDALRQSFITNTVLKRFVSTEEVADAYFYLATTYGVTGTVLTVDNGFTLKLA